MHINLPKITDAKIFHATEGILTEHHLSAWHSPGCKKHKATSLAPRYLDFVPNGSGSFSLLELSRAWWMAKFGTETTKCEDAHIDLMHINQYAPSFSNPGSFLMASCHWPLYVWCLPQTQSLHLPMSPHLAVAYFLANSNPKDFIPSCFLEIFSSPIVLHLKRYYREIVKLCRWQTLYF